MGKKDWALFLCTETKPSIAKVLETYALRWKIEVYFKEVRQHLGFLAEQTRTFASRTTSIHLCVIRYLMLLHATLEYGGVRPCEIRADMIDKRVNDFLVRNLQLKVFTMRLEHK